MPSAHCFLQDTNFSRAWGLALVQALEPGVDLLAPSLVTVSCRGDVDAPESPEIRTLLEGYLSVTGSSSVRTVANTIFPESYWNRAAPRSHLFDRYLHNLPTIRRLSSRNRYGLYFERLISYGPNKKNQLEHIISTYKRGNHRKSALQAAIFDPNVDHTNQRQRGFPCLQHVAFTPRASDGQLAITGFYATQHLDTKAYGNYLGLYRLGQFMAHELDLELAEVNCVASVATVAAPKSQLRALADQLMPLLGLPDGPPPNPSRDLIP